jgi:hypothetical protein
MMTLCVIGTGKMEIGNYLKAIKKWNGWTISI